MAFLLLMETLVLQPSLLSAAPKPILVHYMPWFVARPYSGNWGWHWTMNHFNPENVNSTGEREIASWYYPPIGPYDSADPVVLEYHVLLMKLAGIDGVIVDWYGMDNHLDYGLVNQRSAALLEFTRRAGLKFSLCYEDRTIQQEVTDGFLSSTNAMAHARQTMQYAELNYFADSSYLRWNNQPVLLNFGPQFFKSSGQWQSIFSVLSPSNQPALFTLDNRASGASGAFNWPPMWLSQSTGGTVTASALENYLSLFEQSGSAWPAFVSSAFPRFHDIYAEGQVGPSYGELNDNNGATFRATLERAMTNASAIIQIVTWNDFGEGTIVEPTKQFGYRDLGTVQDLRRQYFDSNFPNRTNDLALATRLYSLRRQFSADALVSAELDRVFTNVASGNLAAANLQLTGLESGSPAIYNVVLEGGSIRFAIGGRSTASGVEVQTTTVLSSADWTAVESFPAGTNRVEFSTRVSPTGAPMYFRVRVAAP